MNGLSNERERERIRTNAHTTSPLRVTFQQLYHSNEHVFVLNRGNVRTANLMYSLNTHTHSHLSITSTNFW